MILLNIRSDQNNDFESELIKMNNAVIDHTIDP